VEIRCLGSLSGHAMAQMAKVSTTPSAAEPDDQTENLLHSETKETGSPSTIETAEQSENSSHSETKGMEPIAGVHFNNEVTARIIPFQHGFDDKIMEKNVMWYNEHEIEAQMIENHRVVRRSQRILKCADEEDTRGLESLMSDKEQLRHERITALVLNEQRKQKMAANHDSERIAKECAKISDKAMAEAIQRGKYDEVVAHGGKVDKETRDTKILGFQRGDDRKKKTIRAKLGKFASSFRVAKLKKK